MVAALVWGDHQFSIIQGMASCAGSGVGLRRLRPPSMVIVLRRLEVGSKVKGREALPHSHSVSDCPLLRPSRRLPQPGGHDRIGRCRSSRGQKFAAETAEFPGASSLPRVRCHNGTMTDGSGEPVSQNDLITRLARDRREGRDTTQDVQELLRLAARANRAALDRLAE
jgi:hypothetical protein